MYYAYDLTGNDFPLIRTMSIAADTAITAGQVVKLSAGQIVAAAKDGTDAIVGVAAETHSGTADSVNTRSDGRDIRVYVSPNAVFACSAPTYTATGGSTTTAVLGAVAAFSDDDFNGGFLKLTKKGASSTITDPIGSTYRITDYTAATDTFTVASIPGGASAGDIFMLFPPDAFSKGDFNSTLQNIDYTGATGTLAKVVEVDLNKGVIYWTPSSHTFAN